MLSRSAVVVGAVGGVLGAQRLLSALARRGVLPRIDVKTVCGAPIGSAASYCTGQADLSEADVLAAQKLWAESITSISKVYAEKGDYVAAAGEAAAKLYGYGHGNVLFKPTLASNNPFRATGEEAMSYFVGAEAMKNDKFKGEDTGFAINGGRGWKDVRFNNHQVELYGKVAHAMGDYIFTDATSGDKVRVEYTFGYKRCEDGKVRICLHHSSVPFVRTASQ